MGNYFLFTTYNQTLDCSGIICFRFLLCIATPRSSKESSLNYYYDAADT